MSSGVHKNKKMQDVGEIKYYKLSIILMPASKETTKWQKKQFHPNQKGNIVTKKSQYLWLWTNRVTD